MSPNYLHSNIFDLKRVTSLSICSNFSTHTADHHFVKHCSSECCDIGSIHAPNLTAALFMKKQSISGLVRVPEWCGGGEDRHFWMIVSDEQQKLVAHASDAVYLLVGWRGCPERNILGEGGGASQLQVKNKNKVIINHRINLGWYMSFTKNCNCFFGIYYYRANKVRWPFSSLVKTFWAQVRGAVPLWPRAMATHAATPRQWPPLIPFPQFLHGFGKFHDRFQPE